MNDLCRLAYKIRDDKQRDDDRQLTNSPLVLDNSIIPFFEYYHPFDMDIQNLETCISIGNTTLSSASDDQWPHYVI